MLQENIKQFRKDRGLTQEELAIRIVAHAPRYGILRHFHTARSKSCLDSQRSAPHCQDDFLHPKLLSLP